MGWLADRIGVRATVAFGACRSRRLALIVARLDMEPLSAMDSWSAC
jgi:hypothetical protein